MDKLKIQFVLCIEVYIRISDRAINPKFEWRHNAMGQIIKNYMFVFIAPLLIGAADRFACRHTKRSYLITAIFTVLAVIGWVVFYTVPSHASELYGIIALLTTSAAIGALLTGLIMRLKRKAS